jgi:LPXTG-site transpeptidase (sortase) family protein
MPRLLSSRWVIALGLLLAIYGIAGTSSLLREAHAISLQAQAPKGSQVDPQIRQTITSSESFTGQIPGPALQSGEAITPFNGSSPLLETELETIESESTAPPKEEAAVGELRVTPPASPEVPAWITIPEIGLDAPVVPAETKIVKVGGKEYQQWLAPDQFASGWHPDSARLGETGNTVLNGHHNIAGEVFGKLVDLEVGDQILVYSTESVFYYQVTNKMILPEKYEQIDVRMSNAQWILPSQDERLTLITCWPYESNTHRLILVAKPFARFSHQRIPDLPRIDQ